MKEQILKGVISGSIAFLIFVASSVVVQLLLDKISFSVDFTALFPPNTMGATVMALSFLNPLIFCSYKKITDLLIYLLFFYISFRAFYTVIFGGVYAIFYILDSCGAKAPFYIPFDFWDVMLYISAYVLIGAVLGVLFAIALNTVKTFNAKKNSQMREERE